MQTCKKVDSCVFIIFLRPRNDILFHPSTHRLQPPFIRSHTGYNIEQIVGDSKRGARQELSTIEKRVERQESSATTTMASTEDAAEEQQSRYRSALDRNLAHPTKYTNKLAS